MGPSRDLFPGMTQGNAPPFLGNIAASESTTEGSYRFRECAYSFRIHRARSVIAKVDGGGEGGGPRIGEPRELGHLPGNVAPASCFLRAEARRGTSLRAHGADSLVCARASFVCTGSVYLATRHGFGRRQRFASHALKFIGTPSGHGPNSAKQSGASLVCALSIYHAVSRIGVGR